MAERRTSPVAWIALCLAGVVAWDTIGGAKGFARWRKERAAAMLPKASAPADPEWARRAVPEPPAGAPLPAPPPLNVVQAGRQNPMASGARVDDYPQPAADPTPAEPHVIKPPFRTHSGYIATPFGVGHEVAGDSTYEIELPPGAWGGLYARLQSFHAVHDRLQGVALRFFVSKAGQPWRALPPIALGGSVVRFTTTAPFDRVRLFLTHHRAQIHLEDLTILSDKAPGVAQDADRELTIEALRADVAMVRVGQTVFPLPVRWISPGPPGGSIRIAPPDGSGVFHLQPDGSVHWDRQPPGIRSTRSPLRALDNAGPNPSPGETWLRGPGLWALFGRARGQDAVEALYDGALGALYEIDARGQARLFAGPTKAQMTLFTQTAQDRDEVRRGLQEPGGVDEGPAKSVRAIRAAYATTGQAPAFQRFMLEALRRTEERLTQVVPLRVGERLHLARLCSSDRDRTRWRAILALADEGGATLRGPDGMAVPVPRSLRPAGPIDPDTRFALYRAVLSVPQITR